MAKVFKILADTVHRLDSLPDVAQRWEILRGFLSYQEDGEIPVCADAASNVILGLLVDSFDRYTSKADELTEKRREAGRKGADATNSAKVRQMSANVGKTENAVGKESANFGKQSAKVGKGSANGRQTTATYTNTYTNTYNNPPIVPPRMGETHTRVREEEELSALQVEEVSKVQDVAQSATSALQDNASALQTPLQTTPQTTAVPVRVTRKFTPPTVEEVAQYCQEKGYTMSPEAFCDYYESVGWRVGRTGKKMEKWRSAVNNWERRDKEMKPKQTTNYEHIDADTRDARELARLNAAYLAIQNGEL